MRSKYSTMLAALVATLAAAAVSATTALAAGAPVVETKSATSVEGTGATLNGTVNPNGAETKYYFEYGTGTLYGKKTAEASAGAGTKALAESAGITGLVEGTKYHFRIVASNASGKTDGADEVFVARPQPEFTKTSSVSGSIGSTTWNTDGIQWAYQAGTMSGTATGPTIEKLTMHFPDGSEGSCNTSDGDTELVLSEVKGRLGYLNKAKHEAGLMLGEEAYSNPLVKCVMRGLGTSASLEGGLIMPITPVNTKTSHFKLALDATGEKNQEEEFTKFEGETEAFPVAFSFPVGRRTVGIAGSVEFETTVETEIKA